jgi:centrosomal protein CEP104
VDLLGEYVAMCIYSKNWQLREAGMQAMETQLSQGGLPKGDHRDEMRHLTKAIGKALKDKVANVFQSGMSNMRTMLDTYGQHVGSRDLASTCSEFVTILMDKTGDNNSRTQSTAAEGLLHLATTPGMDQVIAHQVCKPVKSQSAWKPVLARLNLIQQLLPQFGVHTGKGGQGLPLEGVMAYIGAAFGSAKENVRSTAVKCAVMVYERVGDAMRPQLPTEMNKALREQLELELEEVDPGSAPRATGPPATSAAPPPKKAPSKKVKEAAQPAPPPQKKAAPPPEPAPANEMVDDSAVLEEDPAVYERELAQRESELGPEHPDVAESLSNLAILYNQQGEYDKAQPLYERALAIWERVQGPDSSDVAHTLTDLAVLHLEQGRDEVGRPLLERALEIQRHNLGDDHPDVIAILEVLESDE